MKDVAERISSGSTQTIPGVKDDGIFVVDRNLNIVAANHIVAQWSVKNGNKDEITGKNVVDVLPFINEAAISDIKGVIETSKPIYAEYIWPFERNRIIAADIIPLFAKDASVQAITIAKDFGERTQIIESIIKRELTTRLLLEQVTDGIHIYTFDNEIIYANAALSSRLGYTPEEVMKLNPVDIDISADNSRFPKIRQEMLTKRSMIYETYFITKDSRELNTEVNSNIVQYYGDEAVLSISRDVSERRVVIDDVTHGQNELEQSLRDFEIYTSLLQHDLRSDLQLVLTQMDVSKLEPIVNQRENKTFGVIHAAIDRMTKLLDMLSISTEIAAQDLVSCLNATASVTRTINPDLQITLANNTGVEPVRVSAGRLLPFVWINILRNAANFASSSAQVQIAISTNKDRIMVDITDDGPGVSSEIERQLFEKGASTTGSGYGLYLCRKIVEAYGGTIELVDQERKGALFRVTLLQA